MCLIVISPKGVDKFNDKIEKSIRKSGLTNDDGAGFAYKLDGVVHLQKGFMDISGLLEALKEVSTNIGHNDYELMIHLRNGNVGEISPRMTHPFVCTSNTDILDQLDGSYTYPVIAHNGTFTTTVEKPYMSDTYSVVKNDFSREYIQEMFMEDPEYFYELFAKKVGISRLVMFHPLKSEPFVKIGKWFEEDGLFFSNQSHHSVEYADKGGVPTHSKVRHLPSRHNRNLFTQDNPEDESEMAYAVDRHYKEVRSNVDLYSHLSKDKPLMNSLLKSIYLSKGLYFPEKFNQYYTTAMQIGIKVNSFNYKFLSLIALVDEDSNYVRYNEGQRFTVLNYLSNSKGEYVTLSLTGRMAEDSSMLISVETLEKDFQARYRPIYDTEFRMYLDLCKCFKVSRKTCKQLAAILKHRKNSNTINIGNFGIKNINIKVVQSFIFEICKELGINPETYVKRLN